MSRYWVAIPRVKQKGKEGKKSKKKEAEKSTTKLALFNNCPMWPQPFSMNEINATNDGITIASGVKVGPEP